MVLIGAKGEYWNALRHNPTALAVPVAARLGWTWVGPNRVTLPPSGPEGTIAFTDVSPAMLEKLALRDFVARAHQCELDALPSVLKHAFTAGSPHGLWLGPLRDALAARSNLQFTQGARTAVMALATGALAI